MKRIICFLAFLQVNFLGLSQVIDITVTLPPFGTTTVADESTMSNNSLKGTTHDYNLAIRNRSTTTALNVSVPVSVSGTGFSCTQQPAGTIAAGSSSNMTIHFEANVLGPINGSVTVLSDDPANSSYVIYFSGEVTCEQFIAGYSVSNVTCNGGSDGSLTANALFAGTPPFEYSWSPSGQTTATASNLSAGQHTIIITDANGCTAEATATLTEPAAPVVTPTADLRCGAGAVSVSAVPDAGTITWFLDENGGAALASGGDYTISGNTLDHANLATTTSFWAEVTNGSCVSVNRTEVIATIDDCVTELAAGSCGVTLNEMSDALASNAEIGATNYRYELRSAIDNSFVAEAVTGSSSTLFRMSWVSGVKYGSNYRVRVAAYVDGAWRPYGSVCNVITPLPRLTNCATVLSTALSDGFTVTNVQGATDYRILIRNNTSGFQTVSVRNAADNTFRLSWVSGIQYNTTYQVRVAAYVNGAWKAYGPVCTVTTPSNLTKLEAASCGISLSSLSQALNAYTVSGATNYLFEIRKASDNSLVATGTNSSNFYRLSWRPEIQFNTSYKIRVSAYVNDAWTEYGQSCTVTTPVSGMMTENEGFGLKTSDMALEIRMEAYPNPNDGNCIIQATSEGNYQILNELGQVVQRGEITESNGMQAKVEALQAGIYFVNGTFANEQITQKLIVK